MSLRLVSLKEREEGKGYVRIDWFDDHLQAWAGMARRKAGIATSVIVSDDEDGDEPSAEARTSLEFGDWDGDTGNPAPSWATHAVITSWDWSDTLGGWKRWMSWIMRRTDDGDKWEEIGAM